MASEDESTSDSVIVRQVPSDLLEDLRSRIIQHIAEARNFSAEIHQIPGQPPQLVLSLGTSPGNIFLIVFCFTFTRECLWNIQ